MNLKSINSEYNRIKFIEKEIEYAFEPRSKYHNGRRNIYYEDLKKDFVFEVNTYGFSPFILQKFDAQRRNPNIMKYMKKEFNKGMYNFIKRKNKTGPKVIKIKKEKNQNSNGLYLEYKKPKKEEDKKNFLKKALENVTRNLLNLSTEGDERLDTKEESHNKIPAIKKEKEEEMQVNLFKLGESKILEKFNQKYQLYFSKEKKAPQIKIQENQKKELIEEYFHNHLIGRKDIRKIINEMNNKENDKEEKNSNKKNRIIRCKSQNYYHGINSIQAEMNRKKTFKLGVNINLLCLNRTVTSLKLRGEQVKRKNDEFLLFTRARKFRRAELLSEPL